MNRMSKDTIYRQKAIDAIDVKNVNKGIISALQSIIEELPSAQSEIIRCKDCKLFGDPKCLMCLDGYDWAEPDGYCHMAERREK